MGFDNIRDHRKGTRILRGLSNSCCLPGRIGASPNGLANSATEAAVAAWSFSTFEVTLPVPKAPSSCGSAAPLWRHARGPAKITWGRPMDG